METEMETEKESGEMAKCTPRDRMPARRGQQRFGHCQRQGVQSAEGGGGGGWLAMGVSRCSANVVANNGQKRQR